MAYVHPSISLPAWESATADPTVTIIDGHDIRVQVRSGQLAIHDGPPRQERTRRIPRVGRDSKRLLILAGHGMLTAEAIRWLAMTGLPWAMLDQGNGDTIACSGPARHDPRLLRGQAYAMHEQTGIAATRELLGAKLAGQTAVLSEVFHAAGAAGMVADLAAEIQRADQLDDLRGLEGSAAITYWAVWAERVHASFGKSDKAQVPEHWTRFDSRTSLKWEYPRNMAATDPANAMLNYIYRIAETEAVHACHALGLSPQLGILHADKVGRDSMALDLIEAVRPYCDRIILSMLDYGLGAEKLDRRWFTETYEGQCWLVPPLTHKLASYAAAIGQQLRPHAETVARILADGKVVVPKSRKPKTQPPAMSKRPVRLREGITSADILPDTLWKQVADFIPQPPSLSKRKTGRPYNRELDRPAVASLIGHELLNLPWSAIPQCVTESTARGRLLAWQSDGTWERMTEAVMRSGHLAALIQ